MIMSGENITIHISAAVTDRFLYDNCILKHKMTIIDHQLPEIVPGSLLSKSLLHKE